MRVSNSQINLFRSCPRKWTHRYVLQTPTEQVENNAFFYGKLFHRILELLCIDKKTAKELDFELYYKKALEETEKEYPTLYISVINEEKEGNFFFKSKMKFHYDCFLTFLENNSSLKILATEHIVETSTCKLIIDLVVEINSKFYILDFKTTANSRTGSTTKHRLHFDGQLQLYALYKDIISENLNINLAFGGIGYIEFYKPKNKWLKSLDKEAPEDRYSSFVSYLHEKNYQEESIYATIVKAQDLDFTEFHKNFLITYEEIVSLKGKAEKGEFFGVQNTNNCLQFNQKCEYWDNCYGNFEHPQTAGNLNDILNSKKDLVKDFMEL